MSRKLSRVCSSGAFKSAQFGQAEDGALALDRVRAGTRALAGLHLLTPAMNGFEFLAGLRRYPAWDGVPVVVLTSKDLTPEGRGFLSGGVARVLQKGAYAREALLAEVARAAAAHARPRP